MHDISLAKDYCLLPNDEGLIDFDSTGRLETAYSAYQKKLNATGNVDFGDLILLPYKILTENPEIQKQMQFRFRVIMVDEYQDSNVAQFKLLQALCGNVKETGTYVCVVGDDDQSIYKFRGAEVKNILQFSEVFPDTQIVRLERNYRSTEEILHTADIVIKKNSQRLGKTLHAERGKGAKPVLAFLENQADEAEYCSRLIYNSVLDSEKNTHFKDWAILYRTNAQSLSFEKCFMQKKIPYVVVGSLKFFAREEVKDLISFLELLANAKNEVAFKRIINKPARGLGEKTQNQIVENAQNSLIGETSLIESAKTLLPTFSKKAKEGLEHFLKIFSSFENELKTKDAPSVPQKTLDSLILKIAEESELVEYYKAKDDFSGSSKVENIQEFAGAAQKYECSMTGLLEFLDAIELDRTLSEDDEKSEDAVTLITLHNTKGLEFNNVVITGMEAGVFPREDKIGSELEEERRLFYVGITRARNELYFTTCAARTLYGRTNQMMISPFLLEAGNIFTTFGKVPSYYKQKTLPQKENFSDSCENSEFYELFQKFKKGTTVFNDDFGYGQIISTDFSSGEFVAKVKFENSGIKTFLPQYQKSALEIIKNDF